jgi:outer membrane protein assembly factor BamB
MNRIIFSVVVAVTVVLSFSANGIGASEAAWPTWRGPGMMGVSPDGNPPVTWSETENVKWKVELTGDGSDSSPVIWGDKLFFQTAVKTDKQAEGDPDAQQAAAEGGRRGGRGGGAPSEIYQFNLVCLDRNTGKLLWEKTVTEAKPHQGHHGDHGFASFSPVTDGKYLWAFYGSFGMYCYDLDGNQIWKKDLMPMTTRFGEGNSPTLAGDVVIVIADHEGDSFIYAFDQKTGETALETSTRRGDLVRFSGRGGRPRPAAGCRQCDRQGSQLSC